MLELKLFVFDLDETLWSLSEGLCSMIRPPFERPHRDRLETEQGFWVELKPGVRDLFEFLKSRKRYISVANRNDSGPTIELLDALEITQYLDFPQIAWRPKEDSIRKIIREIQKRDKVTIKPQEVLFVDDASDNITPVRDWGATAFLFGQDFLDFHELLAMLR